MWAWVRLSPEQPSGAGSYKVDLDLADEDGRVRVSFELPMPSMSFLRLAPVA